MVMSLCHRCMSKLGGRYMCRKCGMRLCAKCRGTGEYCDGCS